MTNTVEIMFLGDIVGRPGRRAVSQYFSEIKNSQTRMSDLIIANVENASHGFGLTEKNYNDFLGLGIGAMTSGNHIWDKKEIFDYIERADKLVRPLNYPEGTAGSGSRIFRTEHGVSIGVINLLGRVFMAPIESPWETLKREVEEIKKITPIIIVDFHAEATAEKIALGYFADELGVSAVIGTHTHVQTADEKILKNGAAYITDAGFCGSVNGVIGMDVQSSLKRLTTCLPQRYDVAPEDAAEANGVKIRINIQTGAAESIERFKYLIDFSEVK